MRLALLAALVATLVAAVPAAAFTPVDPLYPKQWYLAEDHAFDAWPTPPPGLAPVEVAIIDSGLDCSLPDFAGRIVGARSFVGGDPCVDTEGHGTIVAGEIAANLDDVGIVGLAYGAQLLIAKVVTPDGTIPLQAEADAIRWAADQGARVINLSLGGPRDPVHRVRDTYSQREEDAVAYAYSKGALLVAAVGNSDGAYATPWPYAGYPAALPHVIGVSALTRSGAVPEFSDRDPIYNDIAAPGVDIFSTFPRPLTEQRPSCALQGYTDCAANEYRYPEGTSFAAPQVAAAAAVLFGLRPALTNSQVMWLLERTADDVNAATGCRQCPLGRDRYSGWGSLDVAKAVKILLAGGPLPPSDRYEPNDEAGSNAYTLWGKHRTLTATLDYYDDPVDVYRIALGKGERVTAKLTGKWAGANLGLMLWRPGTTRVEETPASRRFLAAQSVTPGAVQRIAYRASESGWYYIEAKIDAPAGGAYTLSLAKTPPTPTTRVEPKSKPNPAGTTSHGIP